MPPQTPAFWSRPAAEVLAGLRTTPAGLSAVEAASRLTHYASRRLLPGKRTDAATLLLAQFSSPIAKRDFYRVQDPSAREARTLTREPRGPR
jgi:P-type Mg2+ transporter